MVILQANVKGLEALDHLPQGDQRRGGAFAAAYHIIQTTHPTTYRFRAMVLDDNDSAHTMWSELGYSRQEERSRWVKPAVAQAPPSAAADPGR